jgi:hypothetical protein
MDRTKMLNESVLALPAEVSVILRAMRAVSAVGRRFGFATAFAEHYRYSMPSWQTSPSSNVRGRLKEMFAGDRLASHKCECERNRKIFG